MKQIIDNSTLCAAGFKQKNDIRIVPIDTLSVGRIGMPMRRNREHPLSQNNFQVTGTVKGSTSVARVFGIGGLSSKAIKANAYAQMVKMPICPVRKQSSIRLPKLNDEVCLRSTGKLSSPLTGRLSNSFHPKNKRRKMLQNPPKRVFQARRRQ